MLARKTKTFQKIFDFVHTFEFGTFWNGEFRAYNREDRQHYYRAFKGKPGIEYVYETNEASEPHATEFMRKPRPIESISDFAFYLFKELERQPTDQSPPRKIWGGIRKK